MQAELQRSKDQTGISASEVATLQLQLQQLQQQVEALAKLDIQHQSEHDKELASSQADVEVSCTNPVSVCNLTDFFGIVVQRLSR